jgi:catechol 2,3-dioxygenase-like lactoylglutathione lyase family enzyme
MPDTTYEMLPSTGFTVTHFLVGGYKKAVDFYSRILGGNVVMDVANGKPNDVQVANTWFIINAQQVRVRQKSRPDLLDRSTDSDFPPERSTPFEDRGNENFVPDRTSKLVRRSVAP